MPPAPRPAPEQQPGQQELGQERPGQQGPGQQGLGQQQPPGPQLEWRPGPERAGGLPGPGGGPAAPRRPRQKPTAAPRRELQQRAFAAAVFGLLSLFALSAANMVGHPLYLIGFAVAVALLAIVAGWSAARRARKEETRRPRGSVAAVILGVVSLLLSLFVAAGVIFARQIDAYEQCVSGAPSAAAKQACAQQFMNAVNQQIQGKS